MVSLIRWRRRRNTYLNTYLPAVSDRTSILFARRMNRARVFVSVACWTHMLPRGYYWFCQKGDLTHEFLCRHCYFYPLRTMPRTLETPKILYTVAEAAKLLSLSRGTVYKLIHSGLLLAVYPASHARISAESLHRYVALLETDQRAVEYRVRRTFA